MDAADALDPAPQRRREAMLDRLAAREASRSSSSAAASSPSPAFESVHAFVARFAESKRSIESGLAGVRSLPDPKPALDRASAAVSALDRLLADHSYFLPPFELRSSLKSIADLKDSLDSFSSELAPRKKFSFKTKPSKPLSTNDNQETTILNAGKLNLDAPGLVVRDSPGFKHKKGAILVKKFKLLDESKGEFTLSDLDSCQVYLKGQVIALFIHRLTNCRVFVGPVLGSIHIEEVESCLFMLASHQIRIHLAQMTDFYLRVRSRPIIEDCTGVRFAPYKLVYAGIKEELSDCGLADEMGNWANVDDFRWLRAVQSPNWCLLQEEERMGMMDISDLEEISESG